MAQKATTDHGYDAVVNDGKRAAEFHDVGHDPELVASGGGCAGACAHLGPQFKEGKRGQKMMDAINADPFVGDPFAGLPKDPDPF